jgi:hypothetical protein
MVAGIGTTLSLFVRSANCRRDCRLAQSHGLWPVRSDLLTSVDVAVAGQCRANPSSSAMPVGHLTETTGHIPEFGGHDAGTGDHDGPKYALV